MCRNKSNLSTSGTNATKLTGAVHFLAISTAPEQLWDGDSNCAATQQYVVAQ